MVSQDLVGSRGELANLKTQGGELGFTLGLLLITDDPLDIVIITVPPVIHVLERRRRKGGGREKRGT